MPGKLALKLPQLVLFKQSIASTGRAPQSVVECIEHGVELTCATLANTRNGSDRRPLGAVASAAVVQLTAPCAAHWTAP